MLAAFWLIFSSALIGFGYMIISKILDNRKKKDEDEKIEDTSQQEDSEM